MIRTTVIGKAKLIEGNVRTRGTAAVLDVWHDCPLELGVVAVTGQILDPPSRDYHPPSTPSSCSTYSRGTGEAITEA